MAEFHITYNIENDNKFSRSFNVKTRSNFFREKYSSILKMWRKKCLLAHVCTTKRKYWASFGPPHLCSIVKYKMLKSQNFNFTSVLVNVVFLIYVHSIWTFLCCNVGPSFENCISLTLNFNSPNYATIWKMKVYLKHKIWF